MKNSTKFAAKGDAKKTLFFDRFFIDFGAPFGTSKKSFLLKKKFSGLRRAKRVPGSALERETFGYLSFSSFGDSPGDRLGTVWERFGDRLGTVSATHVSGIMSSTAQALNQLPFIFPDVQNSTQGPAECAKRLNKNNFEGARAVCSF